MIADLKEEFYRRNIDIAKEINRIQNNYTKHQKFEEAKKSEQQVLHKPGNRKLLSTSSLEIDKKESSKHKKSKTWNEAMALIPPNSPLKSAIQLQSTLKKHPGARILTKHQEALLKLLQVGYISFSSSLFSFF